MEMQEQYQPLSYAPGQPMDEIPIDPALLEEEYADGDAVLVDHALGGMPEPYTYDEPGPSTYASPHVPHLYIEGSRPPRSYKGLSHDPLDSLSPTSASAVGNHVRKRGRPPKSQQANGSTPRPSTPKAAAPRIVLKGTGKGKGKAKGSVPLSREGSGIEVITPISRNIYCDFCQGSDEKNRDGLPEVMISCYRCGRSGHPSCLGMKTSRLISAVRSYPWTCIECKTCEVCQVKGEDDKLLFCDGCDRGWHGYCDNPPILKPPKGQYFCPHCRGSRPSNTTSASKPHDLLGSAVKGSKDRSTQRPTETSAPRKKANGSRTTAPRESYEADVFEDVRPRIKIRARKESTRDVSNEPFFASPPPRKIRLRVTSAQQDVEVEEEEEEKVPYGGVIQGADADTTRTKLSDADKAAFERARKAAEEKMGGMAEAAASAWHPPSNSAASPAPSSYGAGSPGPSKLGGGHSSVHRPSLRDRVLQQSFSGLSDGGPSSTPVRAPPAHAPQHAIATAPATVQKIKTIRFGTFDIDTWYSAPYPEEYQNVPDGRLWLCEFCLKYMKSGFVAGRHRMKCKTRHPPGDEIYRDGNISVFEVDGRKNKIYCQNLCLLAKMFLESKTLYYDVEPFLFYVMTEVDDLGARFVGYFSKEKRSMENNVSCIMTLPVRQRKGWGQLLIDFSYLLSKKEGRTGSPERPLSGLGAVTYKKYWQIQVFSFLRSTQENPRMEDISIATSMTLADIFFTLKAEDLIRIHDTPVRETPSKSRTKGRPRGRPPHSRRQASPDENSPKEVELPTRYTITFDRDYIDAVLKKYEARGYLQLRSEKLKYHPFLTTRDAEKPPGVQAHAALIAAMAQRAQPVSHEQDSHHDHCHRDEPSTPHGDGRNSDGRNGDTDEVVKGEDPETLALVAALSASPKRSLRKRSASEQDHGTPTVPLRKRPRREVVSTPPASRQRRSTRGGAQAIAEESPRRSRRAAAAVQPANTSSRDARGARSDGTDDPTGDLPRSTPDPLHANLEAEPADDNNDDHEDEDAAGSADASGEDDDAYGEEDAEGEDDDEYV